MVARPARAQYAEAARLFGLLALLAPAVASAQTSTAQAGGALDRFDPAPAGDTFFGVSSADVTGRLRLSGSLTASYAHDPLVLRQVGSSGGGAPLAWVGSQALLHVQVSAEVLGRLKLSLDVPVMLAEGGTSGTLGPFDVSAPSGAGVGDVRAGARVALLHQDGFVPAAALTFSLWFPSGKASSFEGAGGFRYQPGVAVGATYAHLVWGAAVGARFSSAETATLIGSQIVGSLGVAGRWRGLTVGPEAFFGFDLGDARASIVSQATGTNAEVLLGAHYDVGPVTFGLGAGPGLGRGPGTPSYRLLASVGGTFDALPVVPEGNGAGAAQAKAMPIATPPAPVDTDGDGVPDAEDACPTIVGDATPGAYRRGCPPDRDHDGIFDRDDACPDVPGVASDDPKKNGCPADSDGDGIPDDKDACPYEKGPPNADPKLNGCPTAVRVEGTQIVILQQVNFATGRAEIKPDSFGLLGQVAAVMQDHPEIARLAVDGHTDSQGGEKPNVNLSERRAVSVVTWLTEHGVDARRLEARGFGPRRPIADNKTEAGRAKNRRVEFQIRRRTPEGEAGWRDGPIEEAPPERK